MLMSSLPPGELLFLVACLQLCDCVYWYDYGKQ